MSVLLNKVWPLLTNSINVSFLLKHMHIQLFFGTICCRLVSKEYITIIAKAKYKALHKEVNVHNVLLL